ncbi:class I poly(R)-hydroxyalkanoic acid synthase [Motiliproteus coralliicola]|uniref:Class I poly(R)-hydroxyalkanoic acid synthase n=1 Tax=Motiliproteus coralliicola TaxID=2283196 RepID=A0A369WRK1_9GAMM|nr:class I poly(R)-hydroxyalkanoic acid synthase [Motiliproteus coralliicola]RDE24312.1 class I poly(R)-hydroxyalkanoic acid synthase [Motiliproteus coralliicola]
MDRSSNTDATNFFTAMNAETHKLVEMFGGQVGEQYLDNLNSAWSQLLSRPTDPQGWVEAINEYQRSSLQFWSTLLTGSDAAATNRDSRFKADEWSENPVFNYIKESYLIASKLLNKAVENVNLDDKSQKKLEFFTQQYIDAMSPSNFAATNPEVLQQAVETKGQSLISGLQNLLGDLDKGRITMTDEEAFVLGENVATTEGQVVYENELFQLIQYTPTQEKVAERPLLIVPPCINKFYIMDLQPGNSFAKYNVDQGNNTFMVSWVNATPEQSHLNWDDYIESGVLEALEVVKKITGSKKVNTAGWCIGGTILSTALAVLTERKDNTVSSATFLTTMTDFEEPGDIGVFLGDDEVGSLLQKVEQEGVLNGKNLATAFNMLRSNDLIWSYVVNNYLKGQNPVPFDLLYWNSDPTNLPADFYSFYIRNMYLENNLSKPGGVTICNTPIDLAKIKTPSYFLSCIEDHIAPWKSTYKGTEMLKNCEFVLGASGHIAGVINPASRNRRHFWINGELGGTPDQWLDSAEKQEGSWWSHWSAWLKKRAGKQIEAPKELGSKDHAPIEPAPGRYVAVRID